MDNNITQEELELLAWLHENAKGYGQSFGWFFENVEQAMGVDAEELAKRASYLAEHDLVGINVADMTHGGSQNPECRIMRIWITGSGENYMRAIENVPGIPKRLTRAVVREGGKLLLDNARRLLAELIIGHARQTGAIP